MSLFKQLSMIVLASVLLSACTTLEIGVERKPDSRPPTPTPIAQGQVTIAPAPTPILDAQPYVGTPQPGTLYLGYIEGDPSPALFFRSPASTEEPHLGEALYSDREDWGHRYSFDFQKLSQPRAVLIGEANLSLFSGRESGRLVYVSFSVENTPPCPPAGANEELTPCPTKEVTNRVIEIDQSTLGWREIWTNVLYDKTYTDSDTSAIIDQAVGPHEPGGESFLVLRVAPCCDGILSQPHVMLVVNVATGKEVFLGAVGDVNLSLMEKAVSYQKLGTQRLKCGPDRVVGCDQDGYWTLFEPTGELLKQPLP